MAAASGVLSAGRSPLSVGRPRAPRGYPLVAGDEVAHPERQTAMPPLARGADVGRAGRMMSWATDPLRETRCGSICGQEAQIPEN